MSQAPVAGSASRAMLRGSLPPTVAIGLIVVAGSAAFAGAAGALGAAAGCTVVIGFFGIDLLGGRRWGSRNPDAPVFLAVFGYVVKIVGLGVLLVIFEDTTAVDRTAFAVSAGACAVVWLSAQVRAFSRLPTPPARPRPTATTTFTTPASAVPSAPPAPDEEPQQ